MDPKDIREARRWLEANGWLDRTERPGLTPIFKVRLERVESPQHQQTPGANAPRVKNTRGPLGQTPHPTPGANATPNKNPLTRTTEQEVQEPPCPPQGQHRPEAGATDPRPMEPGPIEGLTRDRDGYLIHPSASATPEAPQRPQEAPQATQPQPIQPAAPRPAPQPLPGPSEQPGQSAPVNPKGRAAKRDRFSPTVDDVPAALLPVQRELLAFWPTRSGAKTSGAWEMLCGQLQKIQGHPQGGTEIVRDQLVQGAMAGIDGKPWQSIRFRNWELYGTKAATPVMGTGFTRRATPEENAAAAVAFIRAREARQAQAAVTARPALVEVMA